MSVGPVLSSRHGFEVVRRTVNWSLTAQLLEHLGGTSKSVTRLADGDVQDELLDAQFTHGVGGLVLAILAAGLVGLLGGRLSAGLCCISISLCSFNVEMPSTSAPGFPAMPAMSFQKNPPLPSKHRRRMQKYAVLPFRRSVVRCRGMCRRSRLSTRSTEEAVNLRGNFRVRSPCFRLEFGNSRALRRASLTCSFAVKNIDAQTAHTAIQADRKRIRFSNILTQVAYTPAVHVKNRLKQVAFARTVTQDGGKQTGQDGKLVQDTDQHPVKMVDRDS